MSEYLIFASTYPQYDDRLFIELQVQYIKFQAQTWGEHVVYRNCFWHSEQFLYTTYSPHVLQKKKSFWQRFTSKLAYLVMLKIKYLTCWNFFSPKSPYQCDRIHIHGWINWHRGLSSTQRVLFAPTPKKCTKDND